ncbi:Toluene-4-monooxygenase electron transfer component [Afipia felis]|uniref:Toluene-4-monooxygenase electron transfer component n=1 Tax=Afipia felis TaxID=1035 RepID=A0A090N7J0_AFIFE|nr:2Fe-2S iron-sulfur cluster binding domain-containing protein [Afipia felis]CEG08688.1 Toluene-4-monooxygenase electron transfer component [Afipia felis]
MMLVEVVDRKGERTAFTAEPGQRLLHAGLMKGIGLPHECGTGTCGNCKASVVTGMVSNLWPQAPGTKVCRRSGEVLLCQTAATSPLQVKLSSAFLAPCQPPCATRSGRLTLKRMLTPDVGLFDVSLNEFPIKYQPGQFVLLSIPGVEGPRAYSMISHEPNEARLNLLIRRSQDGMFTSRIFEGECDEDVEVFGPLGRATFTTSEQRPFIAVAGGSGIAGIMAIIRHALADGHFDGYPSHLFFGLRHPDASYLLDELSEFVERSSGKLQVTVAFSDALSAESVTSRYPALGFSFGPVHEVARDYVRGVVKASDVQKPLFFVGGPPPMVDATMRALITECKISPTEIRYDRFG